MEIDSGGVGEVAEALERLPAVAYGMVSAERRRRGRRWRCRWRVRWRGRMAGGCRRRQESGRAKGSCWSCREGLRGVTKEESAEEGGCGEGFDGGESSGTCGGRAPYASALRAAARGALRLRAGIRASRGARSDAAASTTRLTYGSNEDGAAASAEVRSPLGRSGRTMAGGDSAERPSGQARRKAGRGCLAGASRSARPVGAMPATSSSAPRPAARRADG